MYLLLCDGNIYYVQSLLKNKIKKNTRKHYIRYNYYIELEPYTFSPRIPPYIKLFPHPNSILKYVCWKYHRWKYPQLNHNNNNNMFIHFLRCSKTQHKLSSVIHFMSIDFGRKYKIMGFRWNTVNILEFTRNSIVSYCGIFRMKDTYFGRGYFDREIFLTRIFWKF